MIIMALDHVREFMHNGVYSPDPVNLQTTTAFLFFTRWITHICAPSFLFLAGTSAYLSFRKRNNPSETRRFLLTRGIMLIILDLTIVNFSLWFDVHFRLLLFEVIAAIGFSFILLALFIRLPLYVTASAGLLIIFCHNLLPGNLTGDQVSGFLYSLFFRPGMAQISPDLTLYVAYPFIPWAGILLTGFAAGKIFESDPARQSRIFMITGISSLLLFTVLRFINGYGDPAAWADQKSGFFTFLSFINVTKYPPSLLFILLFIGLMFLVISWSDRINSKFREIVSVYGRVPFFYFIIHIYLIHLGMFVMLFLQGFGLRDFHFGIFLNGRPDRISGISLGMVYVVWAGAVLLLYPVCRWYGRFKEKHRDNKVLRYL